MESGRKDLEPGDPTLEFTGELLEPGSNGLEPRCNKLEYGSKSVICRMHLAAKVLLFIDQ